MAGSTESNARMEALTTNLSTPCGKGYTRDKATGECIEKEKVDAIVETTEEEGNTPPEGYHMTPIDRDTYNPEGK